VPNADPNVVHSTKGMTSQVSSNQHEQGNRL
jgi:hypothetical protein